MEKIKINGVEEDIYYEKLNNGLDVYLYSKEGIYSNYVTFTTKYGSIYNEFTPTSEDKMKTFPKGIAHFLEHKVFAQKDGPQPMEFFAKSGSICNAYTTFRNTTYLFYATNSLEENINYLLDYVQNIYLTDESVENEKRIISEEIHMYEDQPSEVLNEKIRQNALFDNPYKDSIIATVDDINKITKEDLEVCYHTFYHPSNMFLVVTGCFDIDKVMSCIRENQSKKKFRPFDEIKIKKINEKDTIVKEKEIIKSPTDIPKVSYTIKIPIKNFKISRRKLHLYMFILFSSLFDETSSFDEMLKKNFIINNTTYISLINTNSHLLISLINETKNYQEFLDKVKENLKNIKIDEKDFNRKKKVLISNELFAYDSVENINDIIIDNIIYDNKIEENPIDVIKSLTVKELLNLVKLIDFNNASVVILEK